MKNIQTVLVLENSKPLAEKIVSLFSRRDPGIEITLLASPLKLVETARTIAPNLMLLDMRLANNSENLVKRALLASPHSSIIMMADEVNEAYTSKAESIGAHGLVGKPLLERYLKNLFSPKTLPAAGQTATFIKSEDCQ